MSANLSTANLYHEYFIYADRGGVSIATAKRRKRSVLSSPQKAVKAITHELSKDGLCINEQNVLRYFSDTASRQRSFVHLNFDNVYEKVISVLIQDAFIPGGIRPIILVYDDDGHKCELKRDLTKICSVMHRMEVIPTLRAPRVREASKEYLCPQRYKRSVKSGGIKAFRSSPPLWIGNIPNDVRRKICVLKCLPKECSVSQRCGYAKFLRSLRNGDIKLQLYSQKQYDASKTAGEIPIRCVEIGTPSHTPLHGKIRLRLTLERKDYTDYARSSVFLCRKRNQMRAEIERLTKRLEKLSGLFFKECALGSDADISQLHDWLLKIHSLSLHLKNVGGDVLIKNRRWSRLHRRITLATDILLECQNPFENMSASDDGLTITFKLDKPEKDIALATVSA